MIRTTRAMARLATLAVIAGGALSAPFAIGTASATITTPLTAVINGSIGSTQDAAAQSSYPNDGLVRWTASHNNSTISLAGTGAYFPNTANQAADATSNGDATVGNVNVTSPTTATCPTTVCAAHIGDSAAEAVSVFIVDPADATSVSTTVNFNGLFITGCPGSGIDTGRPAGQNYGTPAQNTPQNCVTQAQFGQPLTLTAKYLAGGAGVIQNTQVNISGAGKAQFSGTQPAGCDQVTTTQVNCTSDATGAFSFTLVDNGNAPPATETNFITVQTRNSTGSYPTITSPPGPNTRPTPVELINEGPGGVTPVRVNLISSDVLAPDSANAAGQQPFAEPGDAVKNVYQVEGSCTPVAPAVTCDGTALSGVSVPVTVDHGFITPNCTQGGVTSYAECSFATTPTVGGQAGNLTNSGTTATLSTNVAG
ncbi:MAG TPA: hypothetical protein VHD81_11040, partial [Mycobacteriales bacterium]|nr:hypothetical protein [Mycobacteriales bacterium]